jgi:hypothetical protein
MHKKKTDPRPVKRIIDVPRLNKILGIVAIINSMDTDNTVINIVLSSNRTIFGPKVKFQMFFRYVLNFFIQKYLNESVHSIYIVFDLQFEIDIEK